MWLCFFCVRVYMVFLEEMKRSKFTLLFLTIATLFSCESNYKVANAEKTQIIEAIGEDEYTYIGSAQLPNGIWDTLLLGYSDRENGIYHNKSEAFETLKITGYEFEESRDELFKQRLLIFSFEFNKLEEKRKFEEFQKYILNYQRHSKNQVEFYKQNEKWFLRFEPMP